MKENEIPMFKCLLCGTMLYLDDFEWLDEVGARGVEHKEGRCHAMMVRAGNRAIAEANPKSKLFDPNEIATVCLSFLFLFLVSCGSIKDYEPPDRFRCRVTEYSHSIELVCPRP